MGVAVTPFCDRNTVVVATSQLKFISMFLRPQLSSMEVCRRGSSCPGVFDRGTWLQSLIAEYMAPKQTRCPCMRNRYSLQVHVHHLTAASALHLSRSSVGQRVCSARLSALLGR